MITLISAFNGSEKGRLKAAYYLSISALVCGISYARRLSSHTRVFKMYPRAYKEGHEQATTILPTSNIGNVHIGLISEALKGGIELIPHIRKQMTFFGAIYF